MADELKKDAIGAGSSPAGNGANQAGSPPVEEIIAENKRKAEELKSAKAEIGSMKERLQELEEAENRRELTAKEERERVALKSDVKSEAAKLRELKETQPWIEVAKEEAERVGETKAFEVMLNNELERANDFIDDKAAELDKEPKEFAKELQPFALKYQDKRPSRRNELAYRDWQKAQEKVKSLDEREKIIKDKEDRDLRFREGVGRHVRNESLDQKMENADKKGKLRLMREAVETVNE